MQSHLSLSAEAIKKETKGSTKTDSPLFHLICREMHMGVWNGGLLTLVALSKV